MCDYIYLNLRNGINPQDEKLYAETVHFLRTPEFQEHLVNDDIER